MHQVESSPSNTPDNRNKPVIQGLLRGFRVSRRLVVLPEMALAAGIVHQVALLAGMAALAWFLWQWNLIGWQVG